MAEAVATMKGLTNNNPDQRIGIFLAFAVGYIVIVETVSLASAFVERRVRVAR
jgi:glutamate transport system permease protein